jgi:hypothetical protein
VSSASAVPAASASALRLMTCLRFMTNSVAGPGQPGFPRQDGSSLADTANLVVAIQRINGILSNLVLQK